MQNDEGFRADEAEADKTLGLPQADKQIGPLNIQISKDSAIFKDKEKFADLLQMLRGKILGYLAKHLGIYRREAEDCLQDTILIIWKKINDGQSVNDLLAYAVEVARRTALSRFNKKRRQKEDLFTDLLADESSEFDSELESKFPELTVPPHYNEKGCASKCFEKESLKNRRIFELYEFEGLSAKEVADIFNMTDDDIRHRVFNMRKRLNKCIIECDSKSNTTLAGLSTSLVLFLG